VLCSSRVARYSVQRAVQGEMMPVKCVCLCVCVCVVNQWCWKVNEANAGGACAQSLLHVEGAGVIMRSAVALPCVTQVEQETTACC
jgi:hypothetical protein